MSATGQRSNSREGPPQGSRRLSPAAQRALAEAAERRHEAQQSVESRPQERGGPAGLEPTRYGDWERKGLASDF